MSGTGCADRGMRMFATYCQGRRTRSAPVARADLESPAGNRGEGFSVFCTLRRVLIPDLLHQGLDIAKALVLVADRQDVLPFSPDEPGRFLVGGRVESLNEPVKCVYSCHGSSGMGCGGTRRGRVLPPEPLKVAKIGVQINRIACMGLHTRCTGDRTDCATDTLKPGQFMWHKS